MAIIETIGCNGSTAPRASASQEASLHRTTRISVRLGGRRRHATPVRAHRLREGALTSLPFRGRSSSRGPLHTCLGAGAADRRCRQASLPARSMVRQTTLQRQSSCGCTQERLNGVSHRHRKRAPRRDAHNFRQEPGAACVYRKVAQDCQCHQSRHGDGRRKLRQRPRSLTDAPSCGRPPRGARPSSAPDFPGSAGTPRTGARTPTSPRPGGSRLRTLRSPSPIFLGASLLVSAWPSRETATQPWPRPYA